jgi:hypothetical protein
VIQIADYVWSVHLAYVFLHFVLYNNLFDSNCLVRVSCNRTCFRVVDKFARQENIPLSLKPLWVSLIPGLLLLSQLVADLFSGRNTTDLL